MIKGYLYSDNGGYCRGLLKGEYSANESIFLDEKTGLIYHKTPEFYSIYHISDLTGGGFRFRTFDGPSFDVNPSPIPAPGQVIIKGKKRG